ncbi:MAG: two component transcriptional regulator, LytTR family [Chitinophagaceae bacterium]|nr:two component transcriptional regulator, LytTR family [Chitinophagaceae bacterium]
MQAIIIDDEISSRNALRSSLKMFCTHLEVVAEAEGVAEGLALLKEKPVDVIFLDIRMKDGTGFDLLEQLGETSMKIIFTTAYDEYAVKAFRFSAVDYLLKPIDPDQLIELEIKLLKLNREDHSKQQQAALANRSSLQMIGLQLHDGLQYFRLEELIRCEAKSNYTSFLFKNTHVLASKPLKEYEEILPSSQFFRIHKSHLIHLKYVKGFNVKTSCVEMTDGSVLEVARRRKETFLELMSLSKHA